MAFSDFESDHDAEVVPDVKDVALSLGVMAPDVSALGPTTMSKPRSLVVTVRPCDGIFGTW